ncbi:hypothetical protein [Geomesophilobacter sediminis]|uniref:Uncharacterized protein n=1 Tax=Geomesophilobacter sediminis TaxID=2798584 RepID=A0A8J7JDZ4_9BACT|nr:hypothetical protein [Geomesophilobacter sediminis]MBJ6725543.1 hypothetical protein [Geomesophilobacter sediminis]
MSSVKPISKQDLPARLAALMADEPLTPPPGSPPDVWINFDRAVRHAKTRAKAKKADRP